MLCLPVTKAMHEQGPVHSLAMIIIAFSANGNPGDEIVDFIWHIMDIVKWSWKSAIT